MRTMEVLVEAPSFIIRNSLLKILRDGLTKYFIDASAAESYFDGNNLTNSQIRRIGHVDAIFRYPVKSMGGERLEVAKLGWRRRPRSRSDGYPKTIPGQKSASGKFHADRYGETPCSKRGRLRERPEVKYPFAASSVCDRNTFAPWSG